MMSVVDAVDGSSAGIAMCQVCGVIRGTAKEEPSMEKISTIGLDIAKNVFQVHGIDEAGNIVVQRQLRRRQVLPFFERPLIRKANSLRRIRKRLT